MVALTIALLSSICAGGVTQSAGGQSQSQTDKDKIAFFDKLQWSLDLSILNVSPNKWTATQQATVLFAGIVVGTLAMLRYSALVMGVAFLGALGFSGASLKLGFAIGSAIYGYTKKHPVYLIIGSCASYGLIMGWV